MKRGEIRVRSAPSRPLRRGFPANRNWPNPCGSIADIIAIGRQMLFDRSGHNKRRDCANRARPDA